jgi:hypothetical protein
MRQRFCRTVPVLLVLVFAAVINGGASDDAAEEEARSARLRDMQHVASTLKVEASVDGEFQSVAPIEGARFRYNHPKTHSDDATVWLWGATGRPVALLTLTGTWPNRDNNPTGSWSFELSSLTTAPLRATGVGDWTWRAAAGKLAFEEIPDAPPPAETASRRLRQMKELSRRFNGQGLYGPNLEEHVELRVLPTPLRVYRDETQHVRDGALFIVADATNPEAVLMIELVDEGNKAAWKYAFNRISSGKIRGRLDDKEVWTSGPSGLEEADEAYYLVIRPM